MSDEFPKTAPKAVFATSIFHPNVDLSTGSVCVNTLKRDWDPKMTLSQLFGTIRSLLIEPNEDSALNEEAARLLHEDYEKYSERARLYTRTHATSRVLAPSKCGNNTCNDRRATHIRRKSLKRL